MKEVYVIENEEGKFFTGVEDKSNKPTFSQTLQYAVFFETESSAYYRLNELLVENGYRLSGFYKIERYITFY